MNVLTKRVPRDPDEKQMRIARETAEGLGFKWTQREILLAKSLYAGMVSAASVDPLEAALEQQWDKAHGRAA